MDTLVRNFFCDGGHYRPWFGIANNSSFSVRFMGF